MSDNSIGEQLSKTISCILPLKIDESSMKIIEEMENILYDCLNDCAYSQNGEFLVLISCKTFIIDLKSEKVIHILNDHDQEIIFSVSFSPDGQKLATCAEDFSIAIYSVPNFHMVRRLQSEVEIQGICFSPCSNFIYSGDNDGDVKKWDLNNGEVVMNNRVHSEFISRLKISSDYKYMLCCGDKNVKFIDTDNLKVLHSFCYNDEIFGIAFHPSKRMVAIGGLSKRVVLWNMDDEELIHEFDLGGQICALLFLTPNILLIMSGDGYITSYDVDSYEEIQKVHCDCDESFTSFAVSPSKTQLVCGRCSNETVKLYSIEPDLDSSCERSLIQLSKGSHVLSNLVARDLGPQIIRQLVTAGIFMNQEEYNMIVNLCWDLVDINQVNGGNMHTFWKEESNDSNDDDD
eukprot:TRINITY_DN3171_c3_g1_i1.p1 TRINITY_DN3171_c3_g1~~TRINITY_DN3171_c3_g1_i1.p1  ORF type:complete len:403 (+),score=88.65 TRINITY_DN3171_c3_g1_i1:321-1529(+)